MAPVNAGPVSFQKDLPCFQLKRFVFGDCRRCQNLCRCRRIFENLSSILVGPHSQPRPETVVNAVREDRALLSAVLLPAWALFLPREQQEGPLLLPLSALFQCTKTKATFFISEIIFFPLTTKPNKSHSKGKAGLVYKSHVRKD